MSFLVHFSGPSCSQTAVLQPGAPALTVGRDPQAGVYLPDTERLISRQHLSLQWCDGGARIDVLSKVNSLVTPRGEFTSGQQVVLAAGETAQLGRFALKVTRQQQAAPAPAASPADDPFAIFGSPAAQQRSGPTTVFDDPFFNSPAATPAPLMDTPSALQAMSGNTGAGASSFSGSAAGIQDPLAAFGGAQAAPANPSNLIDEFLGTPGRGGGGLGASSMLMPSPQDQAARLPVDHVHDFNLPVAPIRLQPSPAPVQPLRAPAAPVRSAAPAVDPLAAFAALNAPAAPAADDPLAALAAMNAPAAPAARSADPWSDFPKEWMAPTAAPAPAPAYVDPDPVADMPARPPVEARPPAPVPDDPFSSSTSWRVDVAGNVVDPFSHSFVGHLGADDAFSAPAPARVEVAASSGGGSTASGTGAEEALKALCRGLGLGTSGPQQLSAREWEQLGGSVRSIVQGLVELMNVRAELKKELRAVDRTMLGAQENNPLKTGMELQELLHYLLFMPSGAAGYMPMKQALEEAIGDLRGHEFASLSASRAAVEGAIKDFDPEKLRPALLKGRKGIALMENARLWELYAAHYENKREHMADWLEQVFNRHFMPTYSRETERLRRERQPAQPAPRRPLP